MTPTLRVFPSNLFSVHIKITFSYYFVSFLSKCSPDLQSQMTKFLINCVGRALVAFFIKKKAYFFLTEFQ